MNYSIFTIRALLGTVFAVLIMRFFYPHAGLHYTIGLAIFMVGMAYVTEAWRHRRRAKDRDSEQAP